MADKVYKLKDVPKGQRLKFFFDYYKIHMAVVAFVVLFFVIGIYEMLTAPNFDMQITFFAQDMKISENVLKSIETELEELDIDLNEDGKVDVGITPLIKNVGQNGASGEFNEVAYAEISIGNSVVMITDENILKDFLEPRNAVAKREQLASFGFEGEGYLKIPYEQTLFNDYVEENYFGREMFVVVKPGDIKDETYARQIEAFKKIFVK